MAITQTAIGKVIPSFLGAWSSTTQYKKLDSVLYNGCTYLALKDVSAGLLPTAASQFWTLIASKGDTGGIGHVYASASASATAWASGAVYGDNPAAMNFEFKFGLPQGEKGDPARVASVVADAITIGPSDSAWVSASWSGDPNNYDLSFQFGIPGNVGGVTTVDNIPHVGGNVNLGAVSWNRDQSEALSTDDKQRARLNIDAQQRGNYIVDPEPTSNQFLYYDDNGHWVGRPLNEVPTGANADVGKFLRKTATGMMWANVQTLPAGGAEGVPLIKYSSDDYSVTWGATISSDEIDALFGE